MKGCREKDTIFVTLEGEEETTMSVGKEHFHEISAADDGCTELRDTDKPR